MVNFNPTDVAVAFVLYFEVEDCYRVYVEFCYPPSFIKRNNLEANLVHSVNITNPGRLIERFKAGSADYYDESRNVYLFPNHGVASLNLHSATMGFYSRHEVTEKRYSAISLDVFASNKRTFKDAAKELGVSQSVIQSAIFKDAMVINGKIYTHSPSGIDGRANNAPASKYGFRDMELGESKSFKDSPEYFCRAINAARSLSQRSIYKFSVDRSKSTITRVQ